MTATLPLGAARLGRTAVRRLALTVGVATVAGGLAIGIVTALDPADRAAAAGLGRDLPPPVAAPLRAPRPAPATTAAGPLHRTLAARLRGGQQDQPAPTQRALVGRFVAATGTNGTFRVLLLVNGQRRLVMVTPQTRLPGRLPRAGEPVLVLGQPRSDGVFLARGISLQAKPGGAAAGTPTPTRR